MNDPAMPFLGRALDAEAVRVAFAKLGPAATNVHVSNVRLLQHKPGRRAVIEYTVQFERVDSIAAVESGVLIGKARAKGLDQKTFSIVRELSSEFDRTEPETVRVPRPFGVVPEFNLWLQEKCAGESATQILLSDRALALAPRIAEAMHKVHCSQVKPRRTHTVEDELRILDERLLKVAVMKPEWKERLAKLSIDCIELARALPPIEPRPIHRDFHPGQMLVDGDHLWLLDFDLFSLGDPAVDAGNFIAHVTELSLRHFNDEQHLRGVEIVIENACVGLEGESIRERIKIYAALTLARHIYISTQFKDRQPFTEALLALCEKRIRTF